MSRRTTLGPVSQSTLNTRNGASSRVSLGPARISNGGVMNDIVMKPSRQSIAGIPRTSIGVNVAAMNQIGLGSSRRASIGVSRYVYYRNYRCNILYSFPYFYFIENQALMLVVVLV